MSDIEKWLEANRDRLERLGFSLETKSSDEAVTVIADSETVVFQLTEWPGRALEFHAISYAEDRVISVVQANPCSSVADQCDYYTSQVEAHAIGGSRRNEGNQESPGQ